MKIVIDIPEEIYKASQIIDVKHEDTIQIPLEVIANAILLPKNHGRLLDEKVILGMANKELNWVYDLMDMPDYIAGLPTVLPAESEEKE